MSSPSISSREPSTPTVSVSSRLGRDRRATPEVHDFAKYLVNWVAGTKLIFLMLLIVILVIADDRGLFYTGVAMIISVSSFFWRLFPLVRKMDRADQVDPKN